jgi:hypothetical protein
LVLLSIRFEAGKTLCLAKAIWTAKPKQWGYAQRLLVMCKEEKRAIISFFSVNRGDGYRFCAYMMIDKDVAYASPSTVYRVLKEAGMLQKKADDSIGVKVLNNL